MAVQNNTSQILWKTSTIDYNQISTTTASSTISDCTYDNNNFLDFYNKVHIGSEAETIAKKIDEGILENIYKKYSSKECFKSVTFNPEKLWSDSKCLKQNIVQSVREKLYLDIILLIKTLKSQKEK